MAINKLSYDPYVYTVQDLDNFDWRITYTDDMNIMGNKIFHRILMPDGWAESKILGDIKNKKPLHRSGFSFVGAQGFEPRTLCL